MDGDPFANLRDSDAESNATLSLCGVQPSPKAAETDEELELSSSLDYAQLMRDRYSRARADADRCES